MNHPLDEEIASLIAQLLPLLRERGVSHTSLFTDEGSRIYLSASGWWNEIQVSGDTPFEALTALDTAIGDSIELETFY